MALNKQISYITLQFSSSPNQAQRQYEIPSQNFRLEFEPVFWGETTDEALSGRLYQNYRGYRFICDMTWNRSLESMRRRIDSATASTESFRDMYNYMITYFVQEQMEAVRVYPGDLGYVFSNQNNYIEGVPNVLRYTAQYRNQVGIFVPRIRLRGRDVLTTIPEFYEAV